MAQIPRKYIDNYTKALNKLSADVQAKLAKDLAKIDFTADVATVRDAIIDRMEFYCGPCTDMAAVLAAEFYDGLREQSVGKKLGALADSGREPIATEKAVRGIMQDVVEGKAAEVVIRKLTDRVDYEIKKSAGDCVFRNGKRDPVKVRYARVPSGAETCEFCLMLASRGFVYKSEGTAGENAHYHAGCDCRIVPSFKKEDVEGYNPEELYDQWKHPEKRKKIAPAKTAKKRETNVLDDPDVRKGVVDYANGQYEGIVGYSEFKHSDGTMWTSKTIRGGSEDFNERWLKSVSDEDKRISEALYGAIVDADEPKRTIVRTERDNSGHYATREGMMYGASRSERFGKTPKVGDTLEFGIKSASKDVDFAEKIARDEITGMGNPYGTVAETGSEVLAYRIKNAKRFLDVEKLSDYTDQQEVLFAGKYRVANVRIETVRVETTGGSLTEKVKLTPREYAEREGLEIEYFTSKKGNPMIRFGSRTYGVEYLDKPTIEVDEIKKTFADVKIKYIDLEEI